MTTTESTREYFSPAELSAIYGATAQHWRRLILKGELPGYRLGDVLLAVRREDVEKYILSRPVTGPCAVRDGTRRGKRTGPRARR